ncbi:hypothetical protein ACWDRB_47170 [Nonomuraea sp. NPDC003707]
MTSTRTRVPTYGTGAVIDIPADAVPAALTSEPVKAVVFTPHIYEGARSYTAVAPVQGAPFLALSKDPATQQPADVTFWPSLSLSNQAAILLTEIALQRAQGVAEPRVRCRLFDSYNGRRVVGPSWGGTLLRREGRLYVYADHQAEPIGTAPSYLEGTVRLAKHFGVPADRLDLD